MIIDTLHVNKGSSLLSEFFRTESCDIFFTLKFKEDPSYLTNTYLKQLYRTHVFVRQKCDELCNNLFRMILPLDVKQNITYILFDLPVKINDKDRWSIGFTCPNRLPWKYKVSKWVIVVSIHPSLKKFGGKYANFVYLMHEIGHVYQHLWFNKNLQFLRYLKGEKFLHLRHLTHAIIEWLVDFQLGSKYGISAGHKFLKSYRDQTKSIYEKFLRIESYTIFDCFNDCKNLI